MKVAIIGTGQQGASIALKAAQVGYDVSTFDASEQAAHTFSKLATDTKINISDTAQNAIIDADVIILATPIDRFGDILKDIGGSLNNDTIVTDIGSGKVKAGNLIRENLPANAVYIPAHPVVGKSECGPEHSDPEMYKGETIAIMPQPDKFRAEQSVVEEFWSNLGGNIAHMDAETHDRLYGTISHFEHVVAFALTAASERNLDFALGSNSTHNFGDSFLNTTRISRAKDTMWIPIFTDNKEAILAAANNFKARLHQLKDALENNTSKGLLNDAHNYRSALKNDRAREGLVAEFMQMPSRMSSFASTTGLTTLLSAAITLNAKDTEDLLDGVSIMDVANPSFKDGSAAMLSDPTFVSLLLEANAHDILYKLTRFEQQFDALVKLIESEDKAGISHYIKSVANLRAKDSIPDHRGEDVLWASPQYIRPAP